MGGEGEPAFQMLAMVIFAAAVLFVLLMLVPNNTATGDPKKVSGIGDFIGLAFSFATIITNNKNFRMKGISRLAMLSMFVLATIVFAFIFLILTGNAKEVFNFLTTPIVNFFNKIPSAPGG